MNGVDIIRPIYEDYLMQAAKLEAERKVGDGLFGVGTKPADDPCHDEFAKKLEAELNAYSKENNTSAEVREVLSYIYNMPSLHREPLSAYWMLNAVQGLTLELIKQLSAEDSEVLCKEYSKLFKRWQRLPVQQQVYSALKNVK